MEESSCLICSGQIKQEVKFEMKLELSPEDVLNITENTVACNKCKVEMEETHQLRMQNVSVVESHPHLVKKEIHEEDPIETVGVGEENFMSDIPLCIENRVPLTHKEKVLLTALVKDNAIVENKKTDGATLTEKHRAWEAICRVYNSQPEVSTTRTSGQLRKLWNNLKQRKRKETAALAIGRQLKKPEVDQVSGLDVCVVCPWESTALFENERAEARSKESSPSIADTTNSLSSLPSSSLHKVAPSFLKEKATQHQELLFNLRKQILQEQLQKAVEERLIATDERAAAKKKAEIELRKAEADCELAVLKLKLFKEKMVMDDEH